MKTGLAFSGGKDSWACLWLNEARLENITVMWVNTGKAYPETLEQVEKARAMCPHFVEVPSDQERQNREFGLPMDVVPVNWTQLGQAMTSPKKTMAQSYIDCCGANIARPLTNAARKMGITHIIAGQRRDENHRAPYRNGTIADGIVQMFPIEDWTEGDVLSYLRGKMEIPPHFSLKHSSLDCYDCTAFVGESRDRVEWMGEKHPTLFRAYSTRKVMTDEILSEALHG